MTSVPSLPFFANAYVSGITVKNSAGAVHHASTGGSHVTVRVTPAEPKDVDVIRPTGSVILTYVTTVEQVQTRAGGVGRERGRRWRLRSVLIFLRYKLSYTNRTSGVYIYNLPNGYKDPIENWQM